MPHRSQRPPRTALRPRRSRRKRKRKKTSIGLIVGLSLGGVASLFIFALLLVLIGGNKKDSQPTNGINNSSESADAQNPSHAGARFTRFTSPDGSFSVLMPGSPSHRTRSRQVGASRLTQEVFTLLRNQNRELYAVWYMDIPNEVLANGGKAEFFDLCAQGVAQEARGTLVEKRNIHLNQIPGVEVKVDVPNTGPVTARLFLSDSRLYQVAIGLPMQKADSGESESFLNSFEIHR